MKHKKTTIGLIGMLIMLSPALLQAQNCEPGVDLVPDGRFDTDLVPTGNTFTYNFKSVIGHSYQLEQNGGFLGSIIPATMSFSTDGANCFTFDPTDTARMAPAVTSLVRATRQRVAFIDSGATSVIFAIANFSGFNYPVNIRLIDTALFSPGWSTFGGYNTFWSFSNSSDSPVHVRLYLRDTTGAVVANILRTIPAGGTLSTDANTLGVLPNLNGSASLAHDGPYGVITATAVIANYSLASANPQPIRFEPYYRPY